MLKLSDRLWTMAEEVGMSASVCDVGTDHGYLPLYLYEKNPYRRIIMSDVSKGSLARCREDCERMHPGNSFDLRLGSGLKILKPAEVDCVVMAGMGGILIIDIMNEDLSLTKSFGKFILQPRKHVGRVRKWLSENGFEVAKEILVRESRFIWPILVVKPKADNRRWDARYTEQSTGGGGYYKVNNGLKDYIPEGERDVPYEGNSYREPGEGFYDIEYEYPIGLLDFKSELTESYLKNALDIENKKLESMKRGTSTTEYGIKLQEYRVRYLEELVKFIDNTESEITSSTASGPPSP